MPSIPAFLPPLAPSLSQFTSTSTSTTTLRAPIPPMTSRPRAFPSPRQPHRRLLRPSLPTPHMTASTASDLLIIGAGHLGRRILSQWRALHPLCTIHAETRTDASHARLSSLGATPVIAGESDARFPNVVYCVPPSGAEDYSADVQAAINRCTDMGRFVFTSSSGIHGSDVHVVTETTPRAIPSAPRRQRLIAAEDVVAGFERGFVIRLSGLYTLERGPQSFWFRTGSAGGNAHDNLNMIHYDDAAAAVVALLALEEMPSDKFFLACADTSTTKLEVLQSAKLHSMFQRFDMPTFKGGEPVKKVYDNRRTRGVLQWKPRWSTMVQYLQYAAEQEKKNI